MRFVQLFLLSEPSVEMTEETNVYQEYIDYNLLGCGHIKDAMIVGLDGRESSLRNVTDVRRLAWEVPIVQLDANRGAEHH